MILTLGAVTPPPPPAHGTKLEPSGRDGDSSRPGNYAEQPPFRSDELWSKVLRLLNERNGAITQERFENVFGVRFTTVRRESDATVYLLEAGKDWYFDARVTIYNDKFKFAAPFNGAHSQWFLSWGTVFGGDAKHTCITAEHVRADLLADGWTSPWKSWGFWEEYREQTAKKLRENPPPGGWVYPPLMPKPRADFFRHGDDDRPYRDRLPQGYVFGTGDFADSCVTGIQVTGDL